MAKSLEQFIISGKLLLLETRRIESPESMSQEDWKEYRHLKAQYNTFYRESRQSSRINYQKIRRATDSGAIG